MRTESDERDRDLAITDDAALVRYQAKWSTRLARLQRAHPARWHVAGWSDEEVRDALTLRLIEVVRGDRAAHARFVRPGMEWGLCVVEQHLRELRKRFRLAATPTDFGDAELLQSETGAEARYLDVEADVCRAIAQRNAREQLSRPQRRWLAAMTIAANNGAFFAASGRLNLSAASRQLGKDRSSAQRAYEQLQTCFRQQLEKLE